MHGHCWHKARGGFQGSSGKAGGCVGLNCEMMVGQPFLLTRVRAQQSALSQNKQTHSAASAAGIATASACSLQLLYCGNSL